MYHAPRRIASYALEKDTRPVVLCEYAHCMGNSGGGLVCCFRSGVGQTWLKAVPRLSAKNNND